MEPRPAGESARVPLSGRATVGVAADDELSRLEAALREQQEALNQAKARLEEERKRHQQRRTDELRARMQALHQEAEEAAREREALRTRLVELKAAQSAEREQESQVSREIRAIEREYRFEDIVLRQMQAERVRRERERLVRSGAGGGVTGTKVALSRGLAGPAGCEVGGAAHGHREGARRAGAHRGAQAGAGAEAVRASAGVRRTGRPDLIRGTARTFCARR